LIVLVILVLFGRCPGTPSGLVINGFIGVALLFLTNLVLEPPIPINI
jgi:hypothetical protein